MQQGMSYTREWYNNGEFWLRYDCIWQGSESGSFSVTLRETNGCLWNLDDDYHHRRG